ncbi:uncharacterized protein LAESUDRAFT_742648 [Laetiporus sulphureus 93-53]|uniref:Uncharacterized protein n=1 Tax=Laetiporus sulphureus 93-53 TaxID=1314785 RepID=A0A165EVG7_9APHY|nr:uncharacterized protein LAESUDRAFT_742648 [Laetiporus sulphureus 93-53]KZT07848.1 hypothetical protein LAESUDRAFT_742648 [Laetiporus sulphureus 93-53]
MRPLTLHSSALNDAEYTVYTACLRDLSEEDENDPDHVAAPRADSYNTDFTVGVREARAWLRGRYRSLAPGVLDSILRLFCPKLAPGESLTGGQMFAVLRLVHHALNGKDVDKNLVFVQATESDYDPRPSQPVPPTSDFNTSILSPTSDTNPFHYHHDAQAKPNDLPLPLSRPVPAKPTIPAPPLPSPPPALPPKPGNTNPFLTSLRARRSSEDEPPLHFHASTPFASRARSEGRGPPLPPRKHSMPAPAMPPPRHASQTQTRPTHAHHTSSASLSAPNANLLIQQSLTATRVAQSLKRAEHRLEQERVLEVLKSSSDTNGRTRSNSPMVEERERERAASTSGSSSADREWEKEKRRMPTLPPRPKVSPPASTMSGSTARSMEQVARATLPYRHSSAMPMPSFRSPPSSVHTAPECTTSPALTPPRPLNDLPPEPPPTHPDRKPVSALVLDSDRERGVLPPLESPHLFRSRSMHHQAPPPIPPHRKKRPESVQITPTSTSPVDSPFASPVRGAHALPSSGASIHSSTSQPALSRHSSLSARSRHSDGIAEPIANLQRTLSTLHQKAQPRLDSARFKAEAAFAPRGFVQHSQPGSRWLRQEGEERLMSEDETDTGRDDESVGQDVEETESEKERNERLRKLRLGNRDEVPAVDRPQQVGVERDDLKWPAGNGWKRL